MGVKDSLDLIEILRHSSKAIAEKADFGSILLPMTDQDIEFMIKVSNKTNSIMPNTKLSVYKNRRGSFVRGYLWLDMDKATCRYKVVNATDWNYNPIPVPAFDIKQQAVM